MGMECYYIQLYMIFIFTGLSGSLIRMLIRRLSVK